MTKKILFFSLLLIVSITTFGQNDKEYTKTLKKMFEVSGSEKSYEPIIKQLIKMFKDNYSNVDDKVWKEFENEFLKMSINDLTEMLVPVYSQYLTIEDLKEIIKFYETPVGKKFAKSTPLIMQESMTIGQQWGMKIGEDFVKKMKEKGY